MTRPALINDYRWQNLGGSTIVDLGSAPGDVGLDLLKAFPKLHWVFQDLPAVVEATRPVCRFSRSAVPASTKMMKADLARHLRKIWPRPGCKTEHRSYPKTISIPIKPWGMFTSCAASCKKTTPPGCRNPPLNT